MMMILMPTNMMFYMSSHPMSMGLTLIIQTITMAMISGSLMKTFWMSYILLITMLSGMLVLFIYMSSVASNEKFKNKPFMWMLVLTTLMVSILFLILENKMIIMNNYLSLEMIPLKMKEINFLNKMFNMENMFMTIMIVMYLLYTMIVSTSLINIYEGPMRKKF